MSNRNHRYQNGLRKRAAVRDVETALREGSALVTRSREEVEADLGFRPHFIIDTNVMFALLEYWADNLRVALRRLCDAQPSLGLFVTDAVVSECRGVGREKKRHFAEVVAEGGHGPGFVRILHGKQRDVEHLQGALTSALQSRRDKPLRPSDRKDALIAAEAIAHDMVVLTNNAADFAALAQIDRRLQFQEIARGADESLLGASMLAYLASLYARSSSSKARTA